MMKTAITLDVGVCDVRQTSLLKFRHHNILNMTEFSINS